MSNVGRKNKRITLLQPVSLPDGMGGRKTTYEEAGNVWAEFKTPRVETAVSAGTIASELIREIGIRFRADVKRGWKVHYGAKVFAVEHTYDFDRVDTILVCKEVVK